MEIEESESVEEEGGQPGSGYFYHNQEENYYPDPNIGSRY